MSQSPLSRLTLLKLFRLVCDINQHWPRRRNSSWLCKTKICFKGLKLTIIFLDRPLPVLADTNPSLSLPHGCHFAMSLSLMQAAAWHSPGPLSLSPHSLLFHTHATVMPRSHQPLLVLSLSSSAPLALPILSSGDFTNPRGSTRPGHQVVLELAQGWPWQPVAPKLGGAASAARGRDKTQRSLWLRGGQTQGQESAPRQAEKEEPDPKSATLAKEGSTKRGSTGAEGVGGRWEIDPGSALRDCHPAF